MRKIHIVLYTALLAAFLPFTPAFAKAPHVVDESGVLSEEEKNDLETIAQS